VRTSIAAMTAYSLELREAAIKLNQNESPFDVPRDMKQRVLAALVERPWNLYPDFEQTTLRNAVAKFHGLDAENILVGNGSNELLAAAAGAFVGPGTPVLVPRPTFTLYEKLITIAGGVVIPIEFDPSTGLLPLNAMLEAATPDSVILFCSPNNPTGGVLPAGGIDDLLATGATVLFDRAYGEFAGDALPPLHDRLVTFSTFSKAWGLAALRVGWLASTAATCREIRKVKLPYSLNALSEAIAADALAQGAPHVAPIVDERERMLAAMRGLVEVFPTAANFITFRTRPGVFDELYARGILVRDVSGYPQLRNCVRVSVGTRAQNDAFLNALQEVLA
jgi:histidinol-phosphate aminotransferase